MPVSCIAIIMTWPSRPHRPVLPTQHVLHFLSDRAHVSRACLPSATAPGSFRINGLVAPRLTAVRKHRQRFDIVSSRLTRTNMFYLSDLKTICSRISASCENWHSNCFYSGRPIDFGARAKRSLVRDVNAFTARKASLWHAKSGPPARDGNRQ